MIHPDSIIRCIETNNSAAKECRIQELFHEYDFTFKHQSDDTIHFCEGEIYVQTLGTGWTSLLQLKRWIRPNPYVPWIKVSPCVHGLSNAIVSPDTKIAIYDKSVRGFHGSDQIVYHLNQADKYVGDTDKNMIIVSDSTNKCPEPELFSVEFLIDSVKYGYGIITKSKVADVNNIAISAAFGMSNYTQI